VYCISSDVSTDPAAIRIALPEGNTMAFAPGAVAATRVPTLRASALDRELADGTF
jgi:hypothetical protein